MAMSSWKCVAKRVFGPAPDFPCRYSSTAQAIDDPSAVLVPRPISSRMTRLRGVTLLRIFASSSISTKNVLWPLARSSNAPTRVKIRSMMPIRACRAGTKLPACAMMQMSAAARI